MEFDDFGVYKDTNENQVFILDRVLKNGQSTIVIQFGSLLKLNFRVHRRTATSKMFDMIVCSRNNAPRADICTNYDIDTSGSARGNSVQVVKRANITLPNT